MAGAVTYCEQCSRPLTLHADGTWLDDDDFMSGVCPDGDEMKTEHVPFQLPDLTKPEEVEAWLAS